MPDRSVLTLRRDPNGRPIRAHPLEDGRGRIGWVPRPDEPYRERLRAEEASLPPRKKGYVAAGDPLPDVDAGREADDRVLAVAENAQRVIDRWLPFVEKASKFTPGSRGRRRAPLTDWLDSYLDRHPQAKIKHVLNALRSSPDAEFLGDMVSFKGSRWVTRKYIQNKLSDLRKAKPNSR